MTPDEFWRLTPRELEPMFEGYAYRQEREDWRAGLIAAMIANANRDPKKRRKPFQPADFMPQKARPKKAQTPEQQARALCALTVAMGGKVRTG